MSSFDDEGRIVIRDDSVIGYNHNPGAGYPNEETRVLHQGNDFPECRAIQPELSTMNYPTSSTMTTRDWHNYLVAQLVGASLVVFPATLLR